VELHDEKSDGDMTLRYERKYLVHNDLLHTLRETIRPFVRPDTFARFNGDYSEYTVRSIYLDSLQRAAVYDKLEGLRDRKKLRIRGYDTQQDDSLIFLEIKRKIADRIAKNRAPLLYKNLSRMLDYGEVEETLLKKTPERVDDANRFLFNMHRYQMKPVNLIVYDREPYHGTFDPGVRITFDKNIRSTLYPEFGDLYQAQDYEFPWPDHFILEIKYFDAPMPSWAKAMVQHFKLRHEALSKYVEGYACHPITRVT